MNFSHSIAEIYRHRCSLPNSTDIATDMSGPEVEIDDSGVMSTLRISSMFTVSGEPYSHTGGSGAGKNIQTLGNCLKRILEGSPHRVKFFPYRKFFATPVKFDPAL